MALNPACLQIIENKTNRFEHQLLKEQNSQILSVKNEIGRRILNGERGPYCIRGVMGAGKTTVLKMLANSLNEEGKSILIYRLNDDRAREGEIFDRNGIEIQQDIEIKTFGFGEGIRLVIDDLERVNCDNTVIFLSEAQFGGSSDEINELVKLAEERGISIVFDCLDRLYNAKRIPETELISQLCGSANYQMQPCNTFDQACFGEIPARFVAIDLEGNLVDEKDKRSSHYYSEMPSIERKKLIEKFIFEMEFGENNTLLKNLLVRRNGKVYILFPSHPTLDDAYIPGGNERYMSTSVRTVVTILESLEMNDVAELYNRNYASDIQNPVFEQ